jgi:AhpD family alkylhydroperoxidase
VDTELAELVWLAVSQDNSCRYCFAAHRTFLRIQGFSAQRIERLEQNFFEAGLEPKQRAAIEFARRISRANPMVGAAELERLRSAGFSDAAIQELAVLAGVVIWGNRISTIPALPPEEYDGKADRLLVRLLRPLVARRLRSGHRRGTAGPLPDHMRSGPFQYLVEALEPLPSAPLLWTVLHETFGAPGLTDRCRALVFAVVARGLGCPKAEGEAFRLLVEAGFPESAVEPTLAHLASPELDEIEAVVAPFARDTIRYSEAAPLQRRARDVLSAVGPPAFAALNGVVGVANLVCRIGCVVEAH